MKEDYQKALEKVNFIFFFRTQSLSMDKNIKNKRGLELATSCSSSHKTSSEKFLYLLYIYILSDQVWWCNVKQFLSYSKNYIWKFMQANSWHHKLFHFHLLFWIWKVWKWRGKITQIWISQEWKELFRWNKKHCWRAIIWWKNKNLTKNSRHKLSSC